MFGKMKSYDASLVLLTMFLLFIVPSSEAQVTGSFKGVSFWATEGGRKLVASGGRGVLKNEQGEIVAEGELSSIGVFLTIKAKEGATFTHTPSVEPLPKENWPKETVKDYAVLELTKANRWSLKDSNFLFLLEVPMLNVPQLNIATDKSLARASIVIFPDGTFRLWGYTVTIGEGGGNLKFQQGKIIDGSNTVVKGIDEEILKFPKKQEKVQEDEKNYNKGVEHSETYSADLEKQGLGKIIFDTFYSEAAIFIVHWKPGITHSPDALRELKDALLNASSIEKGSETTVKPGQYVVALRIKVPKDSDLVYEVGSAAKENLLLGPYELVVGGGIAKGFLFKRIQDVSPKYEHLKLQGVKEIMFHFHKGKPELDLWFLLAVPIKAGSIWRNKLQVLPSQKGK